MSRPLIVGIDISLSVLGLGAAVLDEPWQPVGARSFEVVSKATTVKIRREIGSATERFENQGGELFSACWEDVRAQINGWGELAWAYVELPNPDRKMDQLVGMLRHAFWHSFKVECWPVKASAWRKSQGIVGQKREVIKPQAMARALGLGFNCKDDQDAADAACVCRHGWDEAMGALVPAWERAAA